MNKPLTVKEAAEFLSCKPVQVRLYIKKGLIKAYKLGNGTHKKDSKGRWRIWYEDLVAFVNRNSNIKDDK